MAPLDRTYRLNARLDFENNASAEIAGVTAELAALNQQIESLDNNANITFDANIAPASAKIDELKREIADVSGGSARLDVDTDPAERSLDALEARLAAFAAQTWTATVNLRVNGFAQLAALRAALAAIPERRTSTVNVDTNRGVSSLRALGAASDATASSGRVMSSVFGSRVFGVSVGLLITLVAAALPLLGPLAAGLATVGAAGGLAAAGAGLAGGAIFRMIQGIKAGEAGFEGIIAALARFRTTASNAFLPAALAAARLSTQLVNMGTAVLPRLGIAATQTVNAISRGFNAAVGQIMRTNTTMSNFDRILRAIPPVMGNLTRAGTLFGAGMVNVFRAALPAARSFSTALRQISQRFFEWSQTDAARARIQAFLRSAAPVARALGQMIMRLGSALVDLGIRHGPTAARGLQILTTVLVGMIRGISLVLDVVRFLATQFARLPAPVRSFAAGAAAAAVAATALYRGLLLLRTAALVLGILMGPAGLIIAGLALLGGALYMAYQHSQTFRNGVQRVVAFFQSAWPTIAATAIWVRDVLLAAAASIATVVGPYFWQVYYAAEAAFNAVLGAVSAYWPSIRAWIIDNANAVVAWFQAYWPYVLTIIDWVLWAIMGAVGGFIAFWSGAWAGVQMVVEGVVTIIGAVLYGIVTFVGNVVQLVGAILSGDWAGAWQAAKELVSDAAYAIGNILWGAAEVAIGAVRALAEGVVSWFQWAYDAVVGGSIVPDMVVEVGDWMETMVEDGESKATRWARGVTGAMAGVRPVALKSLVDDSPLPGGVAGRATSAIPADVARSMPPPGAAAAGPVQPQRRGGKLAEEIGGEMEDVGETGDEEFGKLQESVTTHSELMRQGAVDETEKMGKDMADIFRDTYEEGESRFTALRRVADTQTMGMNEEVKATMEDMQQAMVRTFRTVNRRGSDQLYELRTSGAETMEAADYEWREPVGESARGIQQYLNDMLYGMGEVISAANLNLTAPEQFAVRLTGYAEGGNTAAELLGFAEAGMVMWDDATGGIAKPGQSRLHWWGEGDSDEAYIVKDRPTEEQLPYLAQAANWHGYNLLPDQQGGHSESFGYAPVVNPMTLAEGGVIRDAIVEGFQFGGTYAWAPHVQTYVDDVQRNVGGTPNTYPGHPGGEAYSADFWGGGGRGSPIDPGLGDAVSGYIHQKATEWALKWLIWWGTMWDPNPSTYYDPSDMHYDHVHATWAAQGEAGFFGGVGGRPAVDIDKLVGQYFPAELDMGDSLPENAGDDIGSQVRTAMIDVLKSSVGTWDGSGSLADWISQGITFGNAIANNSENVSLLMGRALQESSGDPNAQNNWDINAMNGTPSKGLFQIIGPTWEAHRAMYGADAGDFESNWNNPILSTGVATRYMQNVYGGPVGPGGGGYTDGGIATAMQMALVAEKGPELFIPLHDTRAVQLLFDQIVDWRASKDDFSRAQSGSITQRFEAENASVNARLEANTGTQATSTDIRRLGERLEGALTRQVDARITNVEEMVEITVQGALAAQESPAGASIQARHRNKEMRKALDRRK